ncbi:MAG: hypothetical protein H6R00_2223 [Proteobacteria bacterium]|nr:hypothetical protein [Pseudomonadota bacterium]
MHPKFLKRRSAILSKQLAQLDGNIKMACITLAQRVRLAGALYLGEEKAESLERQFQTSVECVLRIPAISEEGMLARRALLEKLAELEDFLDSLPHNTFATPETNPRHDLERCRQSLDQVKVQNINNIYAESPLSYFPI